MRISRYEISRFANPAIAKELDVLSELARKRLASGNWQSGADALYDAENLAYRSGMFDDAKKCREAVESLRRNQIPKWLMTAT